MSQETSDTGHNGVLQKALQALDAALAPGATTERLEKALDVVVASSPISDDEMRGMRNFCVRMYDKALAKRAVQRLPPIQWGKGDLLPKAGMPERDLVLFAELMRACNREVLKRQAAANRPLD